MAVYDLTSRQKELLKTIVEQLKAGTGKEPLIPVVTHKESFLIGIMGTFDRNLRGDLQILSEAGLLMPRLNSKGETIYSVKQSSYDAVENNFVVPDNERKVNINTGGGAYIGGNVSTSGGDFVGKDKIDPSGGISIGRNATGSLIITGDGNTIKSVTSFDDLSRLLHQIQTSLNSSELDSDTIDEIKSDLTRVQEEIKKSDPNKSLILKRLKSSSEYVSYITTEVLLIELLRKSVGIATQLFGGNK